MFVFNNRRFKVTTNYKWKDIQKSKTCCRVGANELKSRISMDKHMEKQVGHHWCPPAFDYREGNCGGQKQRAFVGSLKASFKNADIFSKWFSGLASCLLGGQCATAVAGLPEPVKAGPRLQSYCRHNVTAQEGLMTKGSLWHEGARRGSTDGHLGRSGGKRTQQLGSCHNRQV